MQWVKQETAEGNILGDRDRKVKRIGGKVLLLHGNKKKKKSNIYHRRKLYVVTF